VSLERGFCLFAGLHVSFCYRLKVSISADAHDFKKIETRAVINSLFSMQSNVPKEIHAIPTLWGYICTHVTIHGKGKEQKIVFPG
jgi:hypothetical protein